MQRTREKPAILQDLRGIREVGEDFIDRIDEVHGLFNEPATSLQRIPGKLLATTGLAGGPIWSLHQLRFQDTVLMLTHDGPNLDYNRESLPAAGQFFAPGLSDLLEDESQIVTPDVSFDWPGAEYAQQIADRIEIEQAVDIQTPQGWGSEIVFGDPTVEVSPLSLEFNENPGRIDQSQNVTLQPMSRRSGYGGFCWILAEASESWVVFDAFRFVTNPNSFIWNSSYLVAISIDQYNAPAHEGTATLRFILVDGISATRRLLNSDNEVIQSAEVTVRVTTILTVVIASTMQRSTNYTLRLQTRYNQSYVPAGNINLSVNDTAVTITPSVVSNSGWGYGIREIAIQMVGGFSDLNLVLTALDPDTGLTGNTSLILTGTSQFTLTVEMGEVVWRGINFDLVIAAVGDASYVPSGNVDLLDNHTGDNIAPTFTNNAGWAGGQKTVVCQLAGGAGDQDGQVEAEISADSREGEVDVRVIPAANFAPAMDIYYDLGPGRTEYTQAVPPRHTDFPAGPIRVPYNVGLTTYYTSFWRDDTEWEIHFAYQGADNRWLFQIGRVAPSWWPSNDVPPLVYVLNTYAQNAGYDPAPFNWYRVPGPYPNCILGAGATQLMQNITVRSSL
jgi:hypothetical protein